MPIKLTSLKSNLVAEREGDWVPHPDRDLVGVEFLVRSIHFPAYQTAFNAEIRKISKKSKKIDPDESQALTGRLIAEYLLLGWKGFDTPYSKEVAMEILVDPAYRDLANAINQCATQVGQSNIEFLKEAEGNSEPASDKN